MIVKDIRILEHAAEAMQREIYQDETPITGWESCVQEYITPREYRPVEDWKPIGIGEKWKCFLNTTRFFRVRAKVPAEIPGLKNALLLNMGGESLVRINGKIVQGVTSYKDNLAWREGRKRIRVYLTEEMQRMEWLDIDVETNLNFLEATYSVEDGAEAAVLEEYCFSQGSFVRVDTEKEALYYDVWTALQAVRAFESPLSPLMNCSAQLPEELIRVIDGLTRDGAVHDRIAQAVAQALAIKNDVPRARRVLEKGLKGIAPNELATINFVGQAHIDTAWLWPIKESIRKTAKTFANTLELMERYDDYIFAFSQPQLFAFLEEYYPDLFEKVKARVAEGRVELVGNAWVEMDSNVPSGESLVRQLLYGRQYYLKAFGQDSRVFWMPDVFGYSWALPQIMKRSGVDYFYTSKLVNNDTNRFPHSLFQWQGVDGTRILSYLQKINYNGVLDARLVNSIYDKFDQKDKCDQILMTFGYGDGGGGPSEEMLEKNMRLKAFPGLAKTRQRKAVDFFDEVAPVMEELPVWNDEMYYEFHRGTYTSQAKTKKGNRKGELALRRAEMACVMAQVYAGKEYPVEAIGNLWKTLLTRQFHDILPGSSIHEVYPECEAAQAQVICEADRLYAEAISALPAAAEGTFANFLPWETDGVPAFGFGPRRMSGAMLTADAHRMENDHLLVELDENGNLTRIYDKDNDREVLAPGEKGNKLLLFEDVPEREAAWNIDIEYQNSFEELSRAQSVAVAELNEERAVIRVVRPFGTSKLEQDIILTRDARRIDFVTRVEWYERRRMLKAAFPVKVHSSRAAYEIQFGAIERPTHWNTSYDKARFEVCGHKWADLSEGGYGVSLLNDCKYGYDIKENVMRITLLRSPDYPDPTADVGVHEFTYSLYPHAGDWREGGTVREAYRLNVPLTPCANGLAGSFVRVDKDFAVVDTIKGAEDGNGVILRIYESQGARGKVNVTFAKAPGLVRECNLMEVDEGEIGMNGNGFTFEIAPFEIRTFRLTY